MRALTIILFCILAANAFPFIAWSVDGGHLHALAPFRIHAPDVTALLWDLEPVAEGTCTFTDGSTPTDNPATVICEHPGPVRVTLSAGGQTETHTVRLSVPASEYQWIVDISTVGSDCLTYFAAGSVVHVGTGGLVELSVRLAHRPSLPPGYTLQPVTVNAADSFYPQTASHSRALRTFGVRPAIALPPARGLVPADDPIWDDDRSAWILPLVPYHPGTWHMQITTAGARTASIVDWLTLVVNVVQVNPGNPGVDAALLPPFMAPAPQADAAAVDLSAGLSHAVWYEYRGLGTLIHPKTESFDIFLASFGSMAALRAAWIPVEAAARPSALDPTARALPVFDIVMQSGTFVVRSGSDVLVFVEPKIVRAAFDVLSFKNVDRELLAATPLPGEPGWAAAGHTELLVPLVSGAARLTRGGGGMAIPPLIGAPADPEAALLERVRVLETVSVTYLTDDGAEDPASISFPHMAAAVVLHGLRAAQSLAPSAPTADDWASLGLTSIEPIRISAPGPKTVRSLMFSTVPSYYGALVYDQTFSDGMNNCTLYTIESQVRPLNTTDWAAPPVKTSILAARPAICPPLLNNRVSDSAIALAPAPSAFYLTDGQNIISTHVTGVAEELVVITVRGKLAPGENFLPGTAMTVRDGLAIFVTNVGRCFALLLGDDRAVEVACGSAGRAVPDAVFAIPIRTFGPADSGAVILLPVSDGFGRYDGSLLQFGAELLPLHVTGAVDDAVRNAAILPCNVRGYAIDRSSVGDDVLLDMQDAFTLVAHADRDCVGEDDVSLWYAASPQHITPTLLAPSTDASLSISSTTAELVSLPDEVLGKMYEAMYVNQEGHRLERPESVPTERKREIIGDVETTPRGGLAIFEINAASLCQHSAKTSITPLGRQLGYSFTTAMVVSSPYVTIACLCDPRFRIHFTSAETDTYLKQTAIAGTRTDLGSSWRQQPLSAPPFVVPLSNVFVNPDLAMSLFSLGTTYRVTPDCPPFRRLVVPEVSFDPADCSEFAPGGRRHRQGPPGTAARDAEADPSLLGPDGKFAYNIARYGCPVRMFYGHPRMPSIELWQSATRVNVLDDAPFALYELQGRSDWEQRTPARGHCPYAPVSYAEAAARNPDKAPWDAFTANDYVDCRDPARAGAGPPRSGQKMDYFFGPKGAVPTEFALKLDAGGGVFIFRVRLLDPTLSFCDLYTEFAIDVFGEPLSRVAHAAVAIGVIILCTITALVTFSRFNRGLLGWK